MNKFLTVLITLCGLSLVAVDADARRLGGGKSFGMQRNTQQQATPKAPAQQQQAQQAAGTPAQQPAAATGNKWLGPLAGLAMGAGLMALFMNNGIGGALAGLLLIAAIAGIAMMAFRALRGRAGNAPLQYAAGGLQPLSTASASGAAAHSVAAATAGRWPADFDAAEFLRHARLNFVRLQEAHDARDSAALADFVTTDVLAEVQAQWQAEGDTAGKTDVVTLEAEVLDVVTEGLLYIVSVRFSGLIREDGNAEPQSFAEVWHLEKPLRGTAGWLVSGIQQA
ncbi:MAG: Tim44 domain-containing protein [Betaproteobacteria bacterium]|nr:MAG: Tim44 domain-containing protein [Betaproteobacteria bacterium]